MADSSRELQVSSANSVRIVLSVWIREFSLRRIGREGGLVNLSPPLVRSRDQNALSCHDLLCCRIACLSTLSERSQCSILPCHSPRAPLKLRNSLPYNRRISKDVNQIQPGSFRRCQAQIYTQWECRVYSGA